MTAKEEFIKKLHAKIDEWDSEIDRLSVQAALLEMESRAEFYEQIADLKSRRHQMEEKLRKVQQSGEDAWEDFKSGIDLALDSMSEALRSAASRFK